MGAVGVASMTLGDDGNWTVSSGGAGWVIAISVFFFVFNFAYGAGPIVWTYCAEIFPLKYRARCVAVCTMANWAGNFIIAEFTPVLLDQVQFGTFFIFGTFCIIFAILAAWLPALGTRDRSARQSQECGASSSVGRGNDLKAI